IPQMNQIIDDLLARSGVVTDNDPMINGRSDFGTTSAPQITHFTHPTGITVKASGDARGAGIMIVEGDLTVQGNLEFDGLILVRGRTNVEADPSQSLVTGSATLYGSPWTQAINRIPGPHSIVYYSTQALPLANQIPGCHPLPSPPSPLPP